LAKNSFYFGNPHISEVIHINYVGKSGFSFLKHLNFVVSVQEIVPSKLQANKVFGRTVNSIPYILPS